MAKKSHLRVVKDEADVDVIITNMRRAFMECRDWGHSWRAYAVSAEKLIYLETLRCSRCYSRRHRGILKSNGVLLKTYYSYAEGYLVPGWGRMSKGDKGKLRIAVISAMIASHGRNIVIGESS